MTKSKRISANIPADILAEAVRLAELSQTDTLVAGLKEIIAKSKREKLLSLRGKIAVDIDLDFLRQRTRL